MMLKYLTAGLFAHTFNPSTFEAETGRSSLVYRANSEAARAIQSNSVLKRKKKNA